ncbi:uncharacterized protein METZ01_LOCUS379339, partial [marine metagenome]
KLFPLKKRVIGFWKQNIILVKNERL